MTILFRHKIQKLYLLFIHIVAKLMVVQYKHSDIKTDDSVLCAAFTEVNRKILMRMLS